jgi:hypothetical protein
MLSPFVEKVRLHERTGFREGREKSPPTLLRKALRWARPKGLSPNGSKPCVRIPKGAPRWFAGANMGRKRKK